MTRLRLGVPLWLARRAHGAETYPALRGSIHVDVAIVGGGITGAVLAWRLADAGVRVAVLEATRVGYGSTAASTALLMQEPDDDFVDLAQRYGQRRARRIWNSAGRRHEVPSARCDTCASVASSGRVIRCIAR